MTDLLERPKDEIFTKLVDEHGRLIYDINVPLYEHQTLALRKLRNGKILKGGVGSGKTRVAAAYYVQNEAPRHVYVITTARKRDSHDWEQEFYEWGVGPKAGPQSLPGAAKGLRGRLDQSAQLPSGDGTGAGGGSSDGSVLGERQSSGDRGRGSVLLSLGDHQQPHRGDEHRPDVRTGSAYPGHRLEAVVSAEGERPDHAGPDVRRSQETVGIHTSGHRDLGEGVGNARVQDQWTNVDGVSGHLREDLRGAEVGSYDSGGAYPWVLTVDSWNNLAKYRDVKDAFFIFDEQRLVGSGEWAKNFLRISQGNRWILLSATPGDTWMDYIPVFVANNFYKNRTEFKREHVVYNTFTKFPKVDRYINVGRLMRHRADILVEMPYERHTRRRRVEVDLPFDKEMLDRVLTDRWHVYEERPLTDVGEMFAVARRVVNSDPSRLEMVEELWKKHPKLIVYYNFNYELASLRSLKEYYDIPTVAERSNTASLESLRSLGTLYGPTSTLKESPSSTRSDGNQSLVVPEKSLMGGLVQLSDQNRSPSSQSSPIQKSSSTSKSIGPFEGSSVAEWNGHKHQEIPKTDRWLYLVQYVAGAEAWNCIETDAMIKYSQTYSYKIYEQSEGRIDRLNTPFKDLWYYEFRSNSWIDQAIWRSLKAKESFNVAKFKRMFDQ